MSDIFFNPYPARFVDPNEPGLIAAYTFADGELAQWGKYINRARTGAAYDLTTRQATPMIGYNGGLLGNRAAPFGSWWRGVVVPVGNVNFSYMMEHVEDAVATGFVCVAVNGVAHSFWTTNTGHVGCSFQGGVTSETPWNVAGRGLARYDALYDGTNQILVVNGRIADQDAVAPAALGANLDIGQHGEETLVKVYSVRRTVAEARVSYVREMAKVVVAHWQPAAVGEGPAGGLVTGQCLDEFTCPLGGATLKFEYSRVLNGLALTDSGALSARRIQYAGASRPFFGSYKNKYVVRSNAIGGDNPLISFYNVRDADFTTGVTAQAYTTGASNVAGSWATVLYRNATVLLTVNSPLPANNSICETLFSRHPSGDMRLYSKINGIWYGSPVTVANDVTYLNTSLIGIAPRGSYVGEITCFQGEMESQELNQ